MKKKLIIAAIGTLIAVISFSSCKKDNNGADTDKSPVIKNKTWAGEFNYANGKNQPMSIVFGESGSLTWYEFKNEYSGSWKLENGLLTISIGGSVSFTANISNDNVLTNITSTDISGRKLTSAALNGNDDPLLDETRWVAPEVSVRFKAGNKLDLYFGMSPLPTYTNITYVRKGKAIYFSLVPKYDWFLVMTTGTVMKGLNMAPNDPTLYTFSVTKQ